MAVAMLFLPPLPPVRLELARGFVLGRSPSCDLPIPSVQASRRHAHVCWEGEGFVVRDLSSTNGTFVNGEPVQGSRVLRPGDRIMVGDCDVVFCQVDPGLGVHVEVDDDTIAFTTPPLATPPDALSGDLAEIPAFAALQVLAMGRKTGLFAIVTGTDEQRIWFDAGDPVHAESGNLSGVEAALVLVRAAEGTFTFHPDRVAPARTITRPLPELLIEASRRRDEDAR